MGHFHSSLFIIYFIHFLGPRGPLIEPSMPVRPSVRPPVRAKNPDHLYSLINHRRSTVNLSIEKRGKREKGKRRKGEKEKKRKKGKGEKVKKYKSEKGKNGKREKGKEGKGEKEKRRKGEKEKRGKR